MSCVVDALAQEPELMSLEILRRAKISGYAGSKRALYALIAAVRPAPAPSIVRFEGLPGRFCQHDFGQVDVRYTVALSALATWGLTTPPARAYQLNLSEFPEPTCRRTLAAGR